MRVAHLARLTLVPLTLTLLLDGAQASAPQAGVTIDDGLGDVYNLSLSSLLTTTADGTVLLGDLPAAGTVLGSDASGEWQSDTLDGQAAVSWHSWQTANGLGAGAFDNATNPWAASFTFRLQGHGDPDMSYGFYAKNTTGRTQHYAFVYGEDITPAYSGAYQLSATLGGSLSNTDGSASVSPLSANGKIQRLELSTDGVNYFNAGVDLGDALTSNVARSTAPYGSYAASTTGLAATPLTAWRFNTQFQLTSQGDVFAASGTASLVPEPQSNAMLLAGLGMCALLAYRNRRDR